MHPLENKSQDTANEAIQKQQQIDAKNQETTNKFEQTIDNHPDAQKDFTVMADTLDKSKGVETNLLFDTIGEMLKNTKEEFCSAFTGEKKEAARQAITDPFGYAQKNIVAQRTASHQTVNSAIS